MALLIVLWDTRSVRATWRWLMVVLDEDREIRASLRKPMEER